MKKRIGSVALHGSGWIRAGLIIIFLAGLLLPLPAATVMAQAASTEPPASITVLATGLNNPRGLKFGPDGYLYVAEGGTGGTNSTVGQCAQVPNVGPYTGGMTGRISKISPLGKRYTVVDRLPSSQTNPQAGSFVSGVADVAFSHGDLYAILAGAGCSHGVPDIDNGVIQVRKDGSWKMVADLSAFQKAHPVKNPNPGDFEPDGTWYSMIAVGSAFYAVEPNHGELDRITPQGKISRVIDISASQGHIVPTSVAYAQGRFFVGNLEVFPLVLGGANVLEISRSGKVLSARTGFTNILGVLLDRHGDLYILESTTGNPFPTPGTGMVLRLNRNGTLDTVATGLSLPTAMTFGPDGNLYVSNKGFGFPAGQGEIVRIELHDDLR